MVEMLRVAAGDGRLSAEELDERVERALNARTYGELSGLVDDLPGAQSGLGAAPKPKEVLRIHRFGVNVRHAGRWTVPKRVEVDVTGGNVTLDFTGAIITLPLLQVSAKVMGGNLTLITKPGIVVDTDEVAVIGGNVKAREHPDDRGPVLLRVEVSGRVTGGNITVRPPRPPRRTFWQWLRRAPARAAITARLSSSHHRGPRDNQGMVAHRIDPAPETTVNCFSADHAPRLTVDPGDTIVAGSLDAAGSLSPHRFPGDTGQPTMFSRDQSGHCLTGPIAIRGARPGDMLAVRVSSLEPARGGGPWRPAGWTGRSRGGSG